MPITPKLSLSAVTSTLPDLMPGSRQNAFPDAEGGGDRPGIVLVGDVDLRRIEGIEVEGELAQEIEIACLHVAVADAFDDEIGRPAEERALLADAELQAGLGDLERPEAETLERQRKIDEDRVALHADGDLHAGQQRRFGADDALRVEHEVIANAGVLDGDRAERLDPGLGLLEGLGDGRAIEIAAEAERLRVGEDRQLDGGHFDKPLALLLLASGPGLDGAVAESLAAKPAQRLVGAHRGRLHVPGRFQGESVDEGGFASADRCELASLDLHQAPECAVLAEKEIDVPQGGLGIEDQPLLLHLLGRQGPQVLQVGARQNVVERPVVPGDPGVLPGRRGRELDANALGIALERIELPRGIASGEEAGLVGVPGEVLERPEERGLDGHSRGAVL